MWFRKRIITEEWLIRLKLVKTIVSIMMMKLKHSHCRIIIIRVAMKSIWEVAKIAASLGKSMTRSRTPS